MKSAVFSHVQCELKIQFSSTKVGLRGVLPLGAATNQELCRNALYTAVKPPFSTSTESSGRSSNSKRLFLELCVVLKIVLGHF